MPRMNRISLTFLVSILCGTFFAQTDFYFQEPQPAGVEEKTEIIGEIVGEYSLEDDKNIRVMVTRDSVFASYPVLMYQAVAEIEAEGKYEIKDDKIYGVHSKQGLPVKIINDTAVFIHTAHELIFAPGKSGVMKTYNGVYYFNYKNENGMYSTMALSVRGENLYLHSLDHSVVMTQIREFTDFEEKKIDGVTTYTASPSKDEMIAFYEDKGFKDKIKYIRKPE